MIRVVEWETYQSYKDRTPPWIRFHRKILDNYKFHRMSANARALLPMLWLLASEDADPKSGLIRIVYDEIAFRLRLSTEDVASGVAECVSNGFIEEIRPCNETVTEPYPIRNETVPPEDRDREQKDTLSLPRARKIPTLKDLEILSFDDRHLGWFEDNCPSVPIEELREELVLYCRSKGKKYSDYWATLQTWGRRKQQEKANGKSKKSTGSRADEALGKALAILEEQPTG